MDQPVPGNQLPEVTSTLRTRGYVAQVRLTDSFKSPTTWRSRAKRKRPKCHALYFVSEARWKIKATCDSSDSSKDCAMADDFLTNLRHNRLTDTTVTISLYLWACNKSKYRQTRFKQLLQWKNWTRLEKDGKREKRILLCTHTNVIFKRWSLHFRSERRSRPFRLPLPSSHHHCVLPSKDGSRVIPWPPQKKGTSSHPRTRESGWSSVEMLSFLLWPSPLSFCVFPLQQNGLWPFPKSARPLTPQTSFPPSRRHRKSCEKPLLTVRVNIDILTRCHCQKWAIEDAEGEKMVPTKRNRDTMHRRYDKFPFSFFRDLHRSFRTNKEATT